MEEPVSFAEPRPVKLTVDDFAVLHRAGAFEARGRVELIEGMIVEMSPQLRAHSFAKNEITYRMRQALEALGSPLTAQSEPTVALPTHNAVDPDVALTDAPRGNGFIPLESVALIVEISDSSLAWDLGGKRAIYAAAGVPEYWVVDVPKAKLHRFWSPVAGSFAESDVGAMSGELRSATLPELVIDGAGIL